MDPGAKSKVYPGGFKARQSFAAMEVDQADKGRVRAKERTKEKAGLGVLVLGVEEEKMEKNKGEERQRQKEKVRKEVQSVAATVIGAVNVYARWTSTKFRQLPVDSFNLVLNIL